MYKFQLRRKAAEECRYIVNLLFHRYKDNDLS